MKMPQVLAYPDCDHLFVVETDASYRADGEVLDQKKEGGKIKPIQYASRNMKETEKRYSVCEREDLAVIFALGNLGCNYCPLSLLSCSLTIRLSSTP